MKKVKSMQIFSVFLIIGILISSNQSEGRRKRRAKLNLPVNQILKLEGQVQNNGSQAQEFSGVKDGDVLETSDKSFAIVRVPGLGLYRLGPKTKVKMSKFANRDETRVEVLTGEVFAMIKRLGSHSIQTPKSQMSSSQGFLALASNVGGEEEIAIYDGNVEIKSNAAQESDQSSASQKIKTKNEKRLCKVLEKEIQCKDPAPPDENFKKLLDEMQSLYALP